MSNPRAIVDGTLVPHSAFQRASQRLAQCYDYAEDSAEPICIAVIGESRTGKSRVLEECYTAHPHKRMEEGMDVPILHVTTPSKPTVKGLAELMLCAMGDPRFDAGTENAKTIRLQTLMRQSKTRMVMIDEFQHFYDKGLHKVMFHVADWLKILVDDSKVALIVAGLPSCKAVLEQNEQLAGRFMAPVAMPRFNWKVPEQRGEFIAILAAFHESISTEFDLPALDSDEMAFRCYCGTGGLIGYLTKFLRQAVWNAIDDERRQISLEDLAEAHDQAVWSMQGPLAVESPFSRSFQCVPTEELLARIAAVGTPALEAPRERAVRMGRTPKHVRDVLAT